MSSHRPLLPAVGSVLSLLLSAAGAQQDAADPFAATVRPLLERYCFDCHSTARHKGDLDLEQFATLTQVRERPEVWSMVEEQLTAEAMPPRGKRQPQAIEREAVLGFVRATLADLARAHAGDPGPVVLRRLSNAEFTYTVRDLTGVAALAPAHEFPADGAAGEGFTNVGNALPMSPMLLDKYLHAARELAAHAVLLPDGLGFDVGTTRRDWTAASLERLRAFHRRFVEGEGSDQVDRGGIVVATDGGGRLPLARYFAAALAQFDGASPAEGLSAKYLRALTAALHGGAPSPLLDALRARWPRTTRGELDALVAEIAAWQRTLCRFEPVGHIGKVGGPTAWQVPVDPCVGAQSFRVPLVPGDDGVTLTLRATPVLPSPASERVIWRQPRLRAAGREDLPLRALRSVAAALPAARARGIATAERCLHAAAELLAQPARDPAALAAAHGVDLALLQRWLAWLGLSGASAPVAITDYLDEPRRAVAGHAGVSGFARGELPSLLVNASDRDLLIPGRLAARSVVVHPTPQACVVVAWRAPVAAVVAVRASIADAHPTCGNGVEWWLDHQRGVQRWRHAAGIAEAGSGTATPSLAALAVQPGDLLALRIAPRGTDHTCDLTAIDLAIDAPALAWRLASDVGDDLLAGNPHADRHGHAAVWHFFAEPVAQAARAQAAVPVDSALGRWLTASEPNARERCAADVAALLAGPAPASGPDAALRAQLLAVDGPLCGGWAVLAQDDAVPVADARFGLPGGLFGGGSGDLALDADDLGAPVGEALVCRIPSELAAGAEFVADLTVAAPTQAVVGRVVAGVDGAAADLLALAGPIVVGADPDARARVAAALADFRALFPAALCYAKIVPVDEVVTLTLYHREDEPLRRLLLDDAEGAELERLWAELHFVSHDALLMVDVFEQLWQYVTQDGDVRQFEPLREPIQHRAQEFRRALVAAEPRQLDAVLEFAARAWRRPLAPEQQTELRALYARLRADAFEHDAAVRVVLTRVFTSPAFLYHCETPGPEAAPVPVDDWELAARLSYFLWSSVPDAELRALAAQGRLREPGQVAVQARRMLGDPRVRRLAIEFGCAWLHLHGLDELDEKSERHFPTFAGLRGAMYEEAIVTFVDFFQRDAAILELLTADHVFVNGALAAHYGIPAVGDAWQRVDGARRFGRGGVLGWAAALSKHAGASRTSPILRGNWVCEVLLGERMPRPPKDVPRLPDDEALETLTMRELTERHTRDERCAHCHARMDPYGFALERYDGIGRRRDLDLGGRALDARARARDGAELDDLAGLRDYLANRRGREFVRQFCRKLLGYALGRAVQLSDLPLLEAIEADLVEHGGKVGRVVERIVTSPQFLCIRGRAAGG